jgi:pimeloyl-ACP methyl ester carboxylesterase
MKCNTFSLALLLLTIVSCNHTTESNMSSINEPSQSGHAAVNGINMYYEIYGNGDTPLVLIHGGGSTIQTTFGNLIPLLAKHHKLIAVELQAHGRTSDRDSAESFEQDADDVAGLLKHLKVSKANLLGFSNGGNTSMQIGIRHPEVVNKLVVISAFYKRNGMMPGFFDFMQHASLDNMPKPLQEAYLKVTPSQEGLQTMHDKDRDRMLAFKDWTEEDLHSIKAPALIIAGDRDVATAEHTVEMAHTIPNARLLILPGTHGSFIGEICSAEPGSNMPEITTGLIENFLK